MKIHIPTPIIVEGKYDKIKLTSLLDATIITTDGFGIFNNREKLALIRRLAGVGSEAPRGVILATDSDGAGLVIRNFLKSALPPSLVHHVYIPCVKGKERRKDAPSKEGFLGVEGTDAALLRKAFAPYADNAPAPLAIPPMTKAELFSLGLSGGEGSQEKRRELCRRLELPLNLSSNALLEAINLLGLADIVRQSAP